MRRIPIALAALVASTLAAHAKISGELTEAANPLSLGVPEVAVVRLQALLARNLSVEDWRSAAVKLAEALVVSRRSGDALVLLDDPRLREDVSAKFWRAQALASLQRWGEALDAYNDIAAGDRSALWPSATFGAANALRALGRSDEALAKFKLLFAEPDWAAEARLRAAELSIDRNDATSAWRLLDELEPRSTAQRKERRLLRGRAELLAHHPDKAIEAFETLLKRENASHAVVIGALFGIADAHLQLKTPESGDDVLQDFIDRHPQDVDLPLVFAKLDELYRAERKLSRTELERWGRDPAQPRRALAQWYLARVDLRAGRRDRALESFAAMRRTENRSPVLAPALVEYAQLKMEDGDFDGALAILKEAGSLPPAPEWRDRIEWLIGRIEYRAGRFDRATEMFEQVARSGSPSAKLALFNAALGWLQVGNQGRFLADYNELAKAGGDEQARTELRLEQGLVEAAAGDPKAVDLLQNFVRDFPQDPRASEAWVALAELAFHSNPPRLDEARKNLARAAESKPTATASERADYLMIWIEDSAGGSDGKVIDLAKHFLEQHPAAAVAGDVRMKLAETYYRRQDYANAQTQFELLAQQTSGLLAEKALFFAAESAMSSMAAHSLDQAIRLFDQVVRLNGELKWAARNEQAVIERKLDKPQDALSLYDEVLKSDARPAEKREAICGKGDVLFELGGRENYRRAIDLYDQLGANKDQPLHWRNQALFKKALCLEKDGDRAGALATFYTVLEGETRPDRRRELFWYYKAGFNAARLLEEDGKWDSAAAIYRGLAAAGGSRSEEARTRLDRLRLEHFLWGD